MRVSKERFGFATAILGLLMVSSIAQASDKKDEITVAGHIPLAGGPVSRFLVTRHYSSYYLYAERESGGSVTLIDVTKTADPAVLADVAYPSGGGSGSLFAVSGTTAVVAAEQPTAAPPVPGSQTIRIMDLSDPRNPMVTREFAGVTAIGRDESRHLIFLANSDGVWILHQTLAEDPDVLKQYAHHVVYDH
jgi:hypothetical protein